MSALEGFLGWGLQTGWQVAVLVLLVLVAERLFGRWHGPRGRYALWGLVVLRLALPALPRLPIAPVRWTAEGPALALEQPAPPALPPALPAGRADARRARGVQEAGAAGEAAAEPRARPRPPSQGGAPLAPPAGALGEDATRGLPWRALAGLAWLLGAAALFARGLSQERAFRRQLRSARPVAEPRACAVLERCRARAGVRRTVQLVELAGLRSPALWGFRRPRILLPPGLAARLDEDALARVLNHELAHVRRGDVPFNALLFVLRCLWWPHPLVHLALSRLRCAQEALRDWEAVGLEDPPAPFAYARTLLALAAEGAPAPAAPGAIAFLRREPDTKRRILMIADFRRPSLPRAVCGAALVAGLGLVTLSSATSAQGPAGRAAGPRAGEYERVRVERHLAAPPWRAELERLLDAQVPFQCVDESLAGVLDALRAQCALNLICDPDLLEDSSTSFEVNLDRIRVRELLRVLCDLQGEMDYCLAREVVYFGWPGSLPEELSLRFYRVAPLLAEVPNEKRGDEHDRLMMLVQEMTAFEGGGSWDDEGVWIETWDDLLVVNQTERMHARTEAFLNRLLNRGAEAPGEDRAWRAALHQKLAAPAAVRAHEAQLLEVAADLGAAHELFIRVEGQSDEPVSLELEGVSLAACLGWLAQLSDKHVRLDPTGVALSDRREMELGFHEVGDLFGSTVRWHDEELRDLVEDTIRNRVDPASWDEEPYCSIHYWKDLMVVVQSPAAQSEIGQLLDAVRRATSE